MDIFTALADPTRRTILEMLAQHGKLPATSIYRKFHSSPPAISQHLKTLKKAHLVTVEKKSQQRLYQINPDAVLELSNWVHCLTQVWNEHFDNLEKVLQEEKKKGGGK